jgi:hypothetical protein
MSLPVPSTSSSLSTSTDPRQWEKFDSPLIALTNACQGDLRQLLGAFFSFLHRRTDFYVLREPLSDDNGKIRNMGFAAGEADQLLLAAFRQFPLRRIPSTTNRTIPTKASTSSAVSASTPSHTTTKTPTTAASTTVSKAPSSETLAPSPEAPATEPPPHSHGASTRPTVDGIQEDFKQVQLTHEGLQVPVGNGGTGKGYRWTQILEECTVLVSLPPGHRAKDLQVVMKPQFISVTTRHVPDGGTEPLILLQGDLVERIQPSESSWTLEDGGILTLLLYKQRPMIWKRVLQGDPEIDTTLVDNRRHIAEYDESTQAQIRKIMFDQQQARQGLPSSDQLAGIQPTIPTTLPPGVEYINQAKLDEFANAKKNEKG